VTDDEFAQTSDGELAEISTAKLEQASDELKELGAALDEARRDGDQ
jgi:hypothetical protein